MRHAGGLSTPCQQCQVRPTKDPFHELRPPRRHQQAAPRARLRLAARGCGQLPGRSRRGGGAARRRAAERAVEPAVHAPRGAVRGGARCAAVPRRRQRHPHRAQPPSGRAGARPERPCRLRGQRPARPRALRSAPRRHARGRHALPRRGRPRPGRTPGPRGRLSRPRTARRALARRAAALPARGAGPLRGRTHARLPPGARKLPRPDARDGGRAPRAGGDDEGQLPARRDPAADADAPRGRAVLHRARPRGPRPRHGQLLVPGRGQGAAAGAERFRGPGWRGSRRARVR
ncbi:hypothetical protein GA0115246_114338 [Streptomyces sp. SolWspMP-sol7th]|nr:hypothetical protein GA0115246_114338 [Streptomyces sp. SolWspMP-sol7th]